MEPIIENMERYLILVQEKLFSLMKVWDVLSGI